MECFGFVLHGGIRDDDADAFHVQLGVTEGLEKRTRPGEQADQACVVEVVAVVDVADVVIGMSVANRKCSGSSMITRAMGASWMGLSVGGLSQAGRLPAREVAGRMDAPIPIRSPPVERFTISLDEELGPGLDALIAARGYSNRPEAVRDIRAARSRPAAWTREDAPHCIANLSYVFNHHERELAERVTHDQHAHHDPAWRPACPPGSRQLHGERDPAGPTDAVRPSPMPSSPAPASATGS